MSHSALRASRCGVAVSARETIAASARGNETPIRRKRKASGAGRELCALNWTLAQTSGRNGWASTASASAKWPAVSSWLEPLGAASLPVRGGAQIHKLQRAVPTSSRGNVTPDSRLSTPVVVDAASALGAPPTLSVASAKRTPLRSSLAVPASSTTRPRPSTARAPSAFGGLVASGKAAGAPTNDIALGMMASERTAPAPPTSDEASAVAAETAVASLPGLCTLRSPLSTGAPGAFVTAG
eukprot:scaffold146960_cov30-Tisochrysis_lutea.AAC.6